MAIAVAQTVAATETVTAGTLATSISTTLGNLLVCVASVDIGTTLTINDNVGTNSWSLIDSDLTSLKAPLYIWKTTVASPAAVTSVTVTVGNGNDIAAMRVYEISGANNSAAADVHSIAHQTASTTAANSGTTGTPASALDLAIGAIAWQSTTSITVNPTFANGTGTDHLDVSSIFGTNYALKSSSRVLTGAAAAESYSGTLSGAPNSASWTACVALFKAAAVVPVGTHLSLSQAVQRSAYR